MVGKLLFVALLGALICFVKSAEPSPLVRYQSTATVGTAGGGGGGATSGSDSWQCKPMLPEIRRSKMPKCNFFEKRLIILFLLVDEYYCSFNFTGLPRYLTINSLYFKSLQPHPLRQAG